MANVVPQRRGLWLIEAPLEDFEVRGVVVVGSEEAIVWDTLGRPMDMVQVADLFSPLPCSVVYSHGDWDHVWGTGGLAVAPREVIAHEACAQRFRVDLPGELREKQALRPSEYGEVKLIPPTRTFGHRLDLELGGVEMEIHALPGHTHDSVVAYLPKWRTLLAGDSVESPLPFLYPESPVEKWIQGLEEWAERFGPDPGVVIPAHGPLGGTELLQANIQYLRDLLEGREPLLPGEMSRFYRDTHANNRSIFGVWSRTREGFDVHPGGERPGTQEPDP